MNILISNAVGKIIEILHIVAYFSLIILPLISKNINVLLICINIHSTVIFMWYYTGDCVLTPIENWLMDKKNIKHEKEGNVSNVSLFVKKITGLPDNILNKIMLFIPICMTYISSFRISLIYS